MSMHGASYAKPHAVYCFFDAAGILLYVGCTHRFGGRMEVHQHDKTWFKDITTIKLTWTPNALVGRQLEAATIEAGNPRYNLGKPDPEMIGAEAARAALEPPRGDGLACPKCGATKEVSRKAYCNACLRHYQTERRRVLGISPRLPATTICPKCGGEKAPGPAYCKPCKRVVDREYWARTHPRLTKQ